MYKTEHLHPKRQCSCGAAISSLNTSGLCRQCYYISYKRDMVSSEHYSTEREHKVYVFPDYVTGKVHRSRLGRTYSEFAEELTKRKVVKLKGRMANGELEP